MKTVTIIGAGWLGLPLAQYLNGKEYTVFASRTSENGAQELTEQGLHGFCYQFDNTAPALAPILTQQKTDIVIGCFPPGFRQNKAGQYTQHWLTLAEQSKLAGVKKLIMISSTGVYPDLPEKMTEEKASLGLAEKENKFSEKNRILLAAEQQVLDSRLDYVVLRCSGLIGPKRHPSRFVRNLKQISRQAPANMVHQLDVIRAVTFAIDHLTNEVMNVTTPETVSKAAFYQAALKSVNADITMPPITETRDKLISAEKLCEAGFKYHFQNTLEALAYNKDIAG
ncbi:NAD dependent epimerase/dehydratase family protein [Vibrio aerogenes CECT 7868]|uniref:NAD dependent epimerase/dehydratase family protein n=1 Tax=Vibrio aerogenes CECT 7868 TaxID=1216006 RepID=A0A1M5XVI8_9VIBR|nr:NAD-dependent epimerase/dehydratase family protein [Vibrio aerogenes]SHI03766.1 NAD dependent epimerase/dehydratase family protein [Vibrio aerogenes CECT 7868]